MDPELNELVKENLRLARDTNELLHKMSRAQMWGRIMSYAYWLIIIGLSVGVYYYLKGPLEALLGTYQSLLSGVDKVQAGAQSLPGVEALKALLEKLNIGQ